MVGGNTPTRRAGVRPRFGRALAACVLAFCLAAATGCGSSGKPAYCTDRANLENSIKGLTDLNASSGLSGLKSQLTKIQSDSKALVNSAKGDFPKETSAIQSSVSSLAGTIKAFPSNPSATEIATLATQASRAVTAVQSFYDSSSSKCS
jgi:hypothetical protein